MQDRGKYLFAFLILFLISLLLFILSSSGILKLNFISGIFSPLQREIHTGFVNLENDSPEIKKLKDENNLLTKKLIDQKKLINQNKALMDQFQQSYPKSSQLLPAQVIGSPGFIPGLSVPEVLIINKGESDGVSENDSVVLQNNLIGKVARTNSSRSVVYLLGNNSFSFAGKVEGDKKSTGVIRGQGGGEMLLDNVLLSESLKIGDVVLTNGDVDENGQGLPPDLIVGKITSVFKNSSALFQNASVKTSIDFSRLSTVFVNIQK
jgi:rod shape-determining protein MreC